MKFPPKKNHSTLLDEMLFTFSQETTVTLGQEQMVSPLGPDAPGPEPDEVGEGQG
jgi:hypothetical protein